MEIRKEKQTRTGAKARKTAQQQGRVVKGGCG